eukprot:TRINITY_DN36607_c0_g1_i1.p1 TRINITY_DN36607_c0_g1~~TRINITY_DN36607_c0_g1_i1.p1  ORF type:complete len:188 (+),score=53.22 TRINITY_DN36607_c0_g1_i1:55-618(+)
MDATISSSLPSYGSQFAASTLGHLSLNERARLQNEGRGWARKQKRAEDKARDAEIAAKEAEDKRLAEEQRQAAIKQAASQVFQPSADAIMDPKAYFTQWQQHNQGVSRQVEQLQRSKGPAKGKGKAGNGQGGKSQAATAQPKAHASPAQPPQVPAANRGPPQKKAKVDNTPVSGMGLLGSYGDSDDD